MGIDPCEYQQTWRLVVTSHHQAASTQACQQAQSQQFEGQTEAGWKLIDNLSNTRKQVHGIC